MTQIRVMAADDHPLITQGLGGALQPYDIEVVEPVANGAEVVTKFLELRPDVLILDLRIGAIRGLDVARDLLVAAPKARIVFYSQFDQDHIVREAYRIGGKAFTTKSTDTKLLAHAIIAVHGGETYFLPEIAGRLALLSVRGDESPQAILGEREFIVFKKMAEGLTNAEIAEELNLSLKTIGIVIHSVKETLNVHRTADLTRLALKHQLISSEIRNS